MSVPHSFVSVTIPASQVLTLNSNPVLLVPGQSGYLMNVYSLYVRYVAGAVPFNPAYNSGTGVGDVLIAYSGNGEANGTLMLYQGGNQLLGVGFCDQAVDMCLFMDGWLGQNSQAPFTTSDAPAAPAVDIVGAGLYLIQSVLDSNAGYTTFPTGTNWTQGNGSFEVTVEYSYLLA